MKAVSHYHPLLVSLHWLLALLIVASLGMGYFVLAPMPNSNPNKLDLLELHMAGGMVILALTAVRLIVRWRTLHPPTLTPDLPALSRTASLCHYGFYVLVLLMAATGMATAVAAKLNLIVFARSGDPLPVDLKVFPTRVAHEYLAAVFVALIALHLAAVIYHQVFRKDSALARMAFGSRHS